MQNFRNNAVPPTLPLGFPGGSAVGGANAPYLSQSSGPQCSPRMAEEYAAVQHQSQQNPPRPNQHPNQIVTHHPPHASHILAYGGRNRGNGTGEVLQSHASSGGSSISSNNPYRKELMDHYFSMSGKDRHRRGGQGLGYGLGFGYPNMDGLVPHQYRHAGVGSSGMMAHYPLDYNASTGSGGSGNSGSSSGAFSPSHQYSLSQNASIQSGVGPPIHSRQQAQNYSSQQALHQGQLRGYPTSGHRMPLQFPQYSSPNAPTGTPGMYNSPPQRYHGGNGSSGFECKVNSSSTANTNPSSVSSTNSNSIGPLDGAGHSYPSVYSPYPSQPPHSLQKQAPQPHRGSHHNLTLGYDASQKTHSSSQLHQSPAPGLNDPDNRAGSTAIHPANPSMPHLSPQEISKSPMHSQSHQPQVHQNFSPISNPSPAASTVQSPSCSSSPSPLMGSSEPATTSGPPPHVPSHPLVQKTRSSHSHGRLLQTLPQLSPTPNSSSSISSCGSSSGNVNIAGLNSSSGTVSSSVRPCTAAGVGEENSSTLHPSSPLDKPGPESAINSLNALTSQVANLPNTVQHSLPADSSVTHKFGKDGGYSDHMREHLMQQSMHTLPINQQRSRVVGDNFGTKPGREGTVAFGREIANSEGGVVDDTAVVPRSPMSGREEEHCSAREGERVRQVSGASSSSEKTGSHPLSHNHRNKIQPQTERSGQSLTLQMETEAVTHNSRALTSPTIPQPRKTEYEACASFPKTPPSSSPSSRPPSPQPSPKQPSSCPPASLVPTFSSPSPSVAPPFHPSHATKTAVDSQNSGGETENEGEGKSKKGEESDEWRHGRDTKVNSTEARDRDKYGWKEGMEMHSKPSKRTLEECEKQEIAQYLEDSCTNPNTLETHNASVGVIVSTRSENLQSGTTTEAQTASTCAASHSLHKSHNLRNFSEEGLAHSSAGDSHRLNGEDLDSLCTYSSNHESKMRHKRTREHSVSPPLPSSETEVTCGPSKVLHGTGTEFRNRGRGVMGTDVKYQGYHQPLPSYNVGQRKAAGIAAVDESSRRGSGVDSVRGQECNSELQQILPQPSLLQEVLQGYHLDRRYGRTESLKQKVSNACSESTAHQSHSRHHYITPESARPQVLVSELAIRRDHQSHTGAVTSGKHHPPNPGQGRDRVGGQDTSSHPLDSGGPGTKEEYCGVYKKPIGASPIHSSPSVEQSAQSTFPPPKHINLADYSLPHRRPASSLSTHSPAVQQILLQTPEPVPGIGVPKSLSRTHASSASSLSNMSSSERRSVICDVSPSHRITPERERDGETGHGRSHSLKGGSVASVIQQSHSTPSVMQALEKSKVEQDKDTVVDFKAISKTTEEAQNLTSKSGHFQVEEASIQHPFHSPRPSVDTNSDTQQLSNRRKVESNSICSPSPQQASEHALSNPSPLCSTPSSCQPYFQGLDKASGHCTGLGRYGFGEMRVGTPKAIPYQQKYPSHPHHNVPLQAQPENSKSLKLHPHSLNQPNPLDEQCEWAASNNSRSAENMMSPRSVRPPHQSPQGRRSLDCLPSTQHHLQGNYYDPAKIWGLSERDSVGSVEGGSSQRNPLSAASGAVALPATAASGGRSAQSNAPREELVKSLHQGAASSSHNPSVCNNSSSSGSTYANLGVQQGHGQNRLGGSGDGNPLMMRRRVRSFISPIPAKRQHQDLSQHQRGPSNQYLSPQPNCESKQQTDASPSPDPFHAKMAIPNAPSPTHGKTKILPPRKGRGLKLEAIVQKITPNVKKSSTSNSHTESNHHSGLPNAQVSDCNPETQEEDSCVEANFLRVGSVTGSCLPYLGESLSLDEIMYYKGVEETGPLPPSAYPCDPSQDPQVPKRDAAGKMPRGNIRDMEPDFGIKASVPPITERDGVLERGKDELEIDSDFTLLGPLPPPPPLPRPVQASSPPSSSALSDIQNFTNTYQQLETRKGEHSAANLLRQKLQETGMGLGMDDYAGTDYFGTQPSHHNQNVGACMLNRASHMYQQHLIPSARTPSSMAGLSQLPESKPPENVVPKGYFPSGKKKGRPVGSVNKQKRVQAQSQNASIQTPAVTGTESLLQTPAPAPAPTLAVTAQIVSSSSSAAATSDTSLPTDDKISSVSISTAVPETVKTDVDSKDVQLETELKPGVPNERGDEDEEGEKVWVGSRTRRRRRRGLVGIVEKEDLPAQTLDQFSGYGSFPGYRKSVFAPYIHVERKEVELGAVCTIVNAEDEQMKGENGGDGETDVVLTAISQGTKVDREMEKARETKETEPVISALLESSTSGEVLPSSGYVLSGAVSTESHHFGQLLCCLCNKWANYKNLGDLYGPYYPPDYPSKLPKSQTRQSLLTSRAGSIGTVSTEATDLSIQPTEAQTANSVMPTLQTGCQDVDPVPVAAKYTVCPPGGKDLSALCDSINRVDTDGKELQHHDLSQETANSDGFLKHYEQSELKEKPQSQLQIQQWTAEEVHQRPQHRKLTSHPRFKRRHRSNEDLPKSTPTNSKASLPFQPPPQQFNPDTSEPYSQSDQLAQLPRVPLDPEELWVHEGCIVWASGVYLVNGRLHGLKEALDGARDARCSHCEDLGPTLGCYIKGCTLRYHYLCAVETDCSLNEDNFSLRCLKHKFPLNNSTLKPVYPELSERG